MAVAQLQHQKSQVDILISYIRYPFIDQCERVSFFLFYYLKRENSSFALHPLNNPEHISPNHVFCSAIRAYIYCIITYTILYNENQILKFLAV